MRAGQGMALAQRGTLGALACVPTPAPEFFSRFMKSSFETMVETCKAGAGGWFSDSLDTLSVDINRKPLQCNSLVSLPKGL